MSKDAPNPPAAPDPSVQIDAEARANRYNINTPSGSVTWSQGAGGQPLSYDQWAKQQMDNRVQSGQHGLDVFKNLPTQDEYRAYTSNFDAQNPGGGYTQNVTFSPEQQAIYDNRMGVAKSLFDKYPQGYEFNGATDPTSNKFFEAQKKQLDKSFDRDQGLLDQRLANQGLPMGSQAYDEEMDRFRRTKADAIERASTDSLTGGYAQDLSSRQQAYNEVAAALGGSQLNPVSGAVDTAGAFANQQAGLNRQYQGQMAGYQADVGTANAGAGAAAAIAAAFI